MTNDDRLPGYRLQLFALAELSVSKACRPSGVHRSTHYAWRRRVERHGLEILRRREHPPGPRCHQLPAMVEERVFLFAIARPGLGRVASELAREKWGAISVSHATVWRVLRRHGSRREAPRHTPIRARRP